MDKQEELRKFGLRVKYYRTLRGMTLQELADNTGYTSLSTVGKIEKGKVDISTSKVQAIADALEVSPLDLLGYRDSLSRFQAYAERLNQLSEKDQERALKMIDGIIEGFED